MIRYYGEDISHVVLNWSWGENCDNPKELEIGRALHWAYLLVDEQSVWSYLSQEHYYEAEMVCWRHFDFISVACKHCGAQSPLRAQLTHSVPRSGTKSGEKLPENRYYIDYHPGEEWPKDIVVWRERGFCFEFFRDTLSDSRFGQETFTVDPKVLELIGK